MVGSCGIVIELRGKRFLPANEAYRDENRRCLDAEVFGVLGLDRELLDILRILRIQWCNEPSVHGGKSTKPAS